MEEGSDKIQGQRLINIDGKNYDLNKLSDKAKYLVRQIADLSGKSAEHKFKLDQISVAQEVFTSNLIVQLKEESANIII